jgi:hypothetical protein
MEESSMITWTSFKVRHCDRYCNEGLVYNCSRSSKRTRCSSKCASDGAVLNGARKLVDILLACS